MNRSRSSRHDIPRQRHYARQHGEVRTRDVCHPIPALRPAVARPRRPPGALRQAAAHEQPATDDGPPGAGDADGPAGGGQKRTMPASGARTARRSVTTPLRPGHHRPPHRLRGDPRARRAAVIPVRVCAPQASVVLLVRFDASGAELGSEPLRREGDDWVGAVPDGTVYGLVAEGEGPRFDASKMLLDPRATEVWFPPGHDRRRARRLDGHHGAGPVAVARPPRPPLPPVVRRGVPSSTSSTSGVDDAAATSARRHVRGRSSTSCPGSPRSASRSSNCCPCTRTIPRRAATGGTCRWPSGPSIGSTPPATTPPASWPVSSPPPTPTTSRCGSTSCSTTRPRSTRRGRPTACGGCPTGRTTGSTTTARTSRRPVAATTSTPVAGGAGSRRVVARPVRRPRGRRLPLRPRAGRRPGRVVRRAARRVGRPSGRRHGGRAVGRRRHPPARPGVAGRRAGCSGTTGSARTSAASSGPRGTGPRPGPAGPGSPDVFAAPMDCVNFMTCHDGFTLYDLVAYDRKHNEANGHHNNDGAGGNRSWNCGWEGDDGVPDEVVGAAPASAANAWCLLATSHGVPMVAMGDGSGGPRVATTTPTTRTTRRRGSTGQRATASPSWSGSWGCCWRCATATRSWRSPSGGATPCSSTAPTAPPTPAHAARPGLAHRRPLRDRQRLVGAARVLAAASRPVASRRRHLVTAARRHRGEATAVEAVSAWSYDVGPRSVVILRTPPLPPSRVSVPVGVRPPDG